MWSRKPNSRAELTALSRTALGVGNLPLEKPPAAHAPAVGPSGAPVTQFLDLDSSCQSQFIVDLVFSFETGLARMIRHNRYPLPQSAQPQRVTRPGPSIYQIGTRQEVTFALGGKMTEGRTRNNASDIRQALGICAHGRPGQGRSIISGYHGGERR